MQDMVGRVAAAERKRITKMLKQALTSPLQKRLGELLTSTDGMQRISALKHEPKDFSYKELEREVQRRSFFLPPRLLVRGAAPSGPSRISGRPWQCAHPDAGFRRLCGCTGPWGRQSCPLVRWAGQIEREAQDANALEWKQGLGCGGSWGGHECLLGARIERMVGSEMLQK